MSVNTIKKEILLVKIPKLFTIFFTVDFIEDNHKNKFVHCKKANILLEVDEGKSFDEAKIDFAEITTHIINDAIKENKLFKLLRFWKFELQPIKEVINSKKNELDKFKNEKNLIKYDQDKMFEVSAASIISQTQPDVIWNN